MRYIEDKIFITANGGPFTMENPKGKEGSVTKNAMVSDVLHWLLCSYKPMGGQVLGVSELRSLNKIINCFERDCVRGEYAIEDTDWGVGKSVATNMATINSPRNAPLIEDIFDAASTQEKQEKFRQVKQDCEPEVVNESA